MNAALRRTCLTLVLVSTLIGALVSVAGSAGGSKQFSRVKGIVGFASDERGFDPVFGRIDLPDDDYAVTQENAAALIALPDSSIVALGQNTRVRVGAFNQTAQGPGSTITIDNGTLRFDIRRPAGGVANYHFDTVTSQIAVRGTIGLISFLGGQTLVACLVCQADSVVVSVGQQTLSVLAGQAITVSATGTVVSGAVTNSMLNTFSSSQVSTATASGSSAATAGVSGASTSAGAAGAASAGAGSAATSAVSSGVASGAITSVAAAGAAAAVVATVAKPAAASPAASPAATASPVPTPSPTPVPTPTPLPTASPSPNAPIQLQAKKMATPPPAPVHVAPPAAPTGHAPAPGPSAQAMPGLPGLPGMPSPFRR